MLMRQLLSKFLVVLVVAGIWATTAALSWKDTPSQQTEQASRLYDENRLDEALVSITSAQVGMPDSLELQYNMGNILYRQGSFEDARTGYRVASQDAPPELAQRATYNMGNAAFKAGEVDAAIEAYTNALLIDASDDEARFNLEIALRARRQSQDQQDKKEDQQKQDQEDEEQKSNEGGEQDQQQKDEQKQNQQQEQGTEQEEGEDEQNDKKQPEQLTKDQIEQILAALRQQEEQVEKELHRGAKAGSSSVEKDW